MAEVKPLSKSVQDHMHHYLIDVLKQFKGNVAQVSKASKTNRGNLYKLFNKFGIEPDKYRRK